MAEAADGGVIKWISDYVSGLMTGISRESAQV